MTNQDMQCLIVEDDRGTQKVLQKLLADVCSDITVCSNGAEGIFHLCRSEKPTLILLDLLMPQVSGEHFLEVMESLDARGFLKFKAKCIIVSSVTDYAHLKRLTQFHCVGGALAKPIDPTLLMDQIELVKSQLLGADIVVSDETSGSKSEVH